VLVTVTPKAVGSTTVTFSKVRADTSGDPSVRSTLDQAAFNVRVDETDLGDGTGETGRRCDANPAAPAWAAAISRKNDLSGREQGRLVSLVAEEMAKRGYFDGLAKNQDGYAEAVWDFMKDHDRDGARVDEYGPDDAKRPGWRCGPAS
jgi:hypothetical protein